MGASSLVFSLNISFLLAIKPKDTDPVGSAEKETIFFLFRQWAFAAEMTL